MYIIDNYNINNFDSPYFTVNKYKYYIGTIIMRSNSKLFSRHYGVFIGIKNNEVLILHFNRNGVLIDTLSNFLIENNKIKKKYFSIKYPIYQLNQEILNNIQNSIKTKKGRFNLLINNCEVFAKKTVFKENSLFYFSNNLILLDIIGLPNILSNNNYSIKFNKKVKSIIIKNI